MSKKQDKYRYQIVGYSVNGAIERYETVDWLSDLEDFVLRFLSLGFHKVEITRWNKEGLRE